MPGTESFAPIVIFAYNRADHLQEMLHFLKAADLADVSDLIIFADGAKKEVDPKVKAVHELLSDIKGFKSINIYKNPVNKGLKRSVLEGLERVFQTYDRAIVLEDDICVSKGYLRYMNAALDVYSGRCDIWSISGYMIPSVGNQISDFTTAEVILGPRASSWGWGTWAVKWELANWDVNSLRKTFKSNNNYLGFYSTGGDKVRMLLNEFSNTSDSWAILWDFNHYLNKAYCLYPVRSMVKNIGLDSSGVHSDAHPPYVVNALAETPPVLPQNIRPDNRINSIFARLNRKWYRDILDSVRYLKLKMTS